MLYQSKTRYEAPEISINPVELASVVAGSVPTEYNDGSVTGIEDVYNF